MSDTKTKRIYFVRHGETEANIGHKLQGSDTELTHVGLVQARQIAERVKNLKIDKVIVSDYTRTVQTADCIKEVAGLSYETSALFREHKNPSSFLGVANTSPKWRAYVDERYAHAEDPEWRLEDEENFYDIKTRATEAKKFLEGLDAEDILVVSHGQFLKSFFCAAVFGDLYTPTLYRQFNEHTWVANTGLTIYLIEPDGEWRLLVFNDHAHLG